MQKNKKDTFCFPFSNLVVSRHYESVENNTGVTNKITLKNIFNNYFVGVLL